MLSGKEWSLAKNNDDFFWGRWLQSALLVQAIDASGDFLTRKTVWSTAQYAKYREKSIDYDWM